MKRICCISSSISLHVPYKIVSVPVGLTTAHHNRLLLQHFHYGIQHPVEIVGYFCEAPVFFFLSQKRSSDVLKAKCCVVPKQRVSHPVRPIKMDVLLHVYIFGGLVISRGSKFIRVVGRRTMKPVTLAMHVESFLIIVHWFTVSFYIKTA